VHHHLSHSTLKRGTVARKLWKKLGPNISDFLLLPHALFLFNCDCGDTWLMCWHQARVNPEAFEGWSEVLLAKPSKFQFIEFWHYTKINLALFLKNSFI
jgi:hypothetical protein